MATERGNAKKSFEYKMSKKVAELTQVVHMLFTRNHEREVEIQLTKDLYNQELDRLHQAYQTKMGKLEAKITSLTEKSKSDQNEEAIIKANIDHESRWTKKYESKESQYLTEKTNNVALKEALSKAEQELSLLRSETTDSSLAFSTQLASKESDVERLHRKVSAAERKLTDQRNEKEQLSNTLQNSLTQHTEESQQLRSRLSEAEFNEATSAKRLQQVESELKSLRREVTRKSSTELTSSRRSTTVHTPPSQGALPSPQEMYEELENLRKLVQKYRLELSNREGNFNRMFTEKVPVHVDHRSLKPPTTALLSRPGKEKTSVSGFNDISTESERVKVSQSLQSRSDSSLSGRRSLALTGIRRSVAPPAGRQLLTQYNQQPNFKT